MATVSLMHAALRGREEDDGVAAASTEAASSARRVHCACVLCAELREACVVSALPVALFCSRRDTSDYVVQVGAVEALTYMR